jgi:hypothetical protein
MAKQWHHRCRHYSNLNYEGLRSHDGQLSFMCSQKTQAEAFIEQAPLPTPAASHASPLAMKPQGAN